MCECCCCNCTNYRPKHCDSIRNYCAEEMQIGDKGWILPWEIKLPFISFDTYAIEAGGTVKVRIEKIAPNAYKILANMAPVEYSHIKVGYVVIEKP